MQILIVNHGLNGTHIIDTGQMIIEATDAVRAYSRLGQLRWQHDLSSRADTMLLGDQQLFIACGGSITAWATTTGTLQWQQSNAVLGITTALAYDSHTLFVAGQVGSQVTALNLQSGAQEWSIQGDPGEIIKALFVEGNTVLIQTDGSLTAVQKATGKIIWHRASQIQSLSIDSAKGIIYTIYIDVPNDNSPITSGARAMSLKSGVQIWNVSFPIKVGEIGTISSNGMVWAGQTLITAWDLHGKQLWQIPYVGKPITQVMSIERGSFFLLLDQDGNMTALDMLSGHQHWQVAPGSGDGFLITIQPKLVWITNQDTGNITAFDLSGKMRWSLDGPPSVNEVIVE